MGAYSPVPQFSEADVAEAVKKVLQPTANALIKEGTPFTGILYAGLMMTSQGPKVIEFNTRFGDPETQVVLPRLKSDLVDVYTALLDGKIPELEWYEEEVVGIVVASEGYPGAYEKGTVINGLDRLADDILVFHAGTKKVNDHWTTNGGRVLLLATKKSSLLEAQKRVYSELDKVSKNGLYYRTDIANKAISRVSFS
ncbi:phosphoribosylamine-glycine ligase [Halalkalibacter akibai JCM 9157]|uniref:phosphoribosylamine--glycine ligase n=1 Tax=Halalkalibacter akibai (strain ATCC 43226 / DSM 21942 / CIP 109018 / JCM 9157 / 1139) TaxID=1236973 RepID=W4QVS3_HALA3|nr:phosphoribosylamine-glycine ligase [Halalkalibacter akibai JCM 9157]